MRSAPLIDHTLRFREYLDGDGTHHSKKDVVIEITDLRPDSNTESKTEQKAKLRVVDRIDKIIELIDSKTLELEKIVAESLNFNSNVDDVAQKFKACSDQINTISAQVLKIVKTYEKSEPMVFRHYIVIVKEKLQTVEKISSKFRRSQGTSYLTSNSSRDDFDTFDSKTSEQTMMLYRQDDQLRQTVLEREQAIMQIERSVAEINQQFVDVQVMIAMQGEMIDTIDANVVKSLDYVKEGTEELHTAERYDNTNKKMKRRITASVVIGGVIATLTTFTLKKLQVV
ncbi:putative t-snare protein [Yasminevirus sp. GU-2018]|uniref:Putative t-snare protein n=1 Tax=Yasminevirus sp. GU-2018 TaxID=2420051 RepID=A0A5K0UBB5_9VIRU|nr:putative t-snare protein [Yasminevirus sp. GU-2018]